MSCNGNGGTHLPSERRERPRIRPDTQVLIHRVEEGTQLGDAVDLGMGGIRFQCPGTELSVEFSFAFGRVGAARASGRPAEMLRRSQPKLPVPINSRPRGVRFDLGDALHLERALARIAEKRDEGDVDEESKDQCSDVELFLSNRSRSGCVAVELQGDRLR